MIKTLPIYVEGQPSSINKRTKILCKSYAEIHRMNTQKKPIRVIKFTKLT